jgi:hypothetical protein
MSSVARYYGGDQACTGPMMARAMPYSASPARVIGQQLP